MSAAPQPAEDMFADHIPLGEQIIEVEREIAQRRRVYPRWVAAGHLTYAKADRQLKVLLAVLETLRKL